MNNISDDLRHIKSFSEAFREARKLGLSQFKWGNKGMVYGTKTKLEVDNEKVKKALGDAYQEGYNYNFINDGNTIQLLASDNNEYRWNKVGNTWKSASKVNGQWTSPNIYKTNNYSTTNNSKPLYINAREELGDLYTPGYLYTFTDPTHAYTEDTAGNRYNYVKGLGEWYQVPKTFVRSHQQGGQLNMNEQQLQQAFIQFLALKTGAKNQLELEAAIQSMGELGLLQAYQEFMQLILQQQVQAAKFGAKLNYIKSLRGQCPDGYEMLYFKSGGQLCKKCIKKQQEIELGSKSYNSIDEFKCGRKMKKKEQGGSVEFDKCGKKMKKKAEGGDINYDKCGGKTKKKSKKQEGGTFDPKTYSNAVLAKCGTKLKEAAKSIDTSKCGSKMKKSKTKWKPKKSC